MSSTNSLTASQWSRKKTSPSPAYSTTAQTENSRESLLIEDLELEGLNGSPQSSSGTAGEETESSKIFGEKVPAVVSEKCHMNDLYILVKVPTNPQKYIPTSNKSSQTRKEPTSCRTMFSIQEEEDEEHSVAEPRGRTSTPDQAGRKNQCWVREQDDIEEFSSQTQVRNHRRVSLLPNQMHEHIEELSQEVPCKSHQHPTLPQPCHDQIEMQEVNLKDNARVSLENYGILVTPTKTPRTDHLLVFQVDTEKKSEKPRSRGPSCFEWLTKCFRRKRRKTDLMHAKVYKTYFVKWKKCADVTDCPRCQAGRTMRRNST